ncbi:unnamed protein product [Polarella glacialis]|uniref:Uncharacterized protein n=1 Tax=Polarella glacialis TaxID=89957 RepID=A0A813G971_POLGL|nr:unnamed protein product [Polarella glacialis]
MALDLKQPPFDFGLEKLFVTCSVQLSTERLDAGLAWLAARVQAQDRLHADLCSRFDPFETEASSLKEGPPAPADSEATEAAAEARPATAEISPAVEQTVVEVGDSALEARLAALEQKLQDLLLSSERSLPAPLGSAEAETSGSPLDGPGAALPQASAFDTEAAFARLEATVEELRAESARDVTDLRSQVQGAVLQAKDAEAAARSAAAASASAPVATAATPAATATPSPASLPGTGTGPVAEPFAGMPAAFEEFRLGLGEISSLRGRVDGLEASLKSVASSLPEIKELASKSAAFAAASAAKPQELEASKVPTKFEVPATAPTAQSAIASKPVGQAEESSLTSHRAEEKESRGSTASTALPGAPALSVDGAVDDGAEVEAEGEGSGGLAKSRKGPSSTPTSQNPQVLSRGMTRQASLTEAVDGAGQEAIKMRLQAVEQWQQHVEEQIQKLEAAGATAAPPQTSGGRWPDVQEELERFRKLFEFIEGVLPQDAAEAMRFFNQRSLASSKGLAQSLGPEVDIERNRVKWENDFQNTTSDLHHEFENLMLVIKVLQRDADVSGSKLGDLGKRMSRFEARDGFGERGVSCMEEQPHQEPSPRSPRGEGVHALKFPQADLSYLLDPESRGRTGGADVSKQLEETKEEVMDWLDQLRSSILVALQQKVDFDQLQDILQKAGGATGEDRLALFAKRTLIGRCASCETPINVDLLSVKRPQSVALQDPWPTHGLSLGAKFAIRPETGKAASPRAPGRLPRISIQGSGSRDFPKGKVLRNAASTPDLGVLT